MVLFDKKQQNNGQIIVWLQVKIVWFALKMHLKMYIIPQLKLYAYSVLL